MCVCVCVCVCVRACVHVYCMCLCVHVCVCCVCVLCVCVHAVNVCTSICMTVNIRECTALMSPNRAKQPYNKTGYSQFTVVCNAL